ncbi:MAG TPA: chemotaxis protein CheA [Usitatibacter sp.]|jgi:two-component system chemotaxis sensor kinase CheA|nr:chemotaxis protein CheA [Usitatibacter sp.]
MAIDLNRFIATFFDEAQEHLESIEEKAMSLASGRHDPELLNSIFRAAHSIKGGSGTFGFTQLAEATHEMETLFDQLRKGQRLADASTVRLLLDACDVFKGHLARLKGGDRSTDPAMDGVRERVARYRESAGAAAAAIAPVPAAASAPAHESFFAAGPAEDAEFGVFDAGLLSPEPVRAPAAAAIAEKFGFFEAVGADAPPSGRDNGRARGVEQSSIRVSTEKIDRIVNLVGELVIAQAMMQQAAGRFATQQDEHLNHSLSALDRHTRDLQQAVMSIRMMPMEFVFSRFPRLVYDVSTRLEKKVELRTHGHETELDKEMIELLIDPLTHVVRNAIDHGIEPPAERRAAGKPESGTVSMRATHRGGSVIIEVSDDGRGLDRYRLLAKARDLAMPCDDAWSDAEVFALIFEAGFSTAKEVTDLSGRGVGMDVVRRNIASLGGSVSITSTPGQGTTITIQLPLTLAVLDGMVVSVGDEQYIVPLEFVAEAIKPDANDVKTVANQASLVQVRGEHLPLIRLSDVVALPDADPARAELCLVVEVDNRRAALLIEGLLGQQQLVVKSLDTHLHAVPGTAGATILGDGRVALILDVNSIVRTNVARARMAA